MSKLRETFRQVLKLNDRGLPPHLIAQWCEVDLQTVNEVLASLDGMTADQKRDLSIILSMTTQEQMEEWREQVGERDALYGAALLDVAGLNVLDYQTRTGPYPQAASELKRIRDL